MIVRITQKRIKARIPAPDAAIRQNSPADKRELAGAPDHPRGGYEHAGDDEPSVVASCDLYRFAAGRLVEITSYTIAL
jgi:hypothetical protein